MSRAYIELEQAAHIGAENTYSEVTAFPVDVPTLERAIYVELCRQERVFLDHLNDAANAAFGPEERSPA